MQGIPKNYYSSANAYASVVKIAVNQRKCKYKPKNTLKLLCETNEAGTMLLLRFPIHLPTHAAAAELAGGDVGKLC